MSIHTERPEAVDTADPSRLRYIKVLAVPLDREPEVQPVEPCEMAYQLLIGGFVDVSHRAETWKVLSSEGARLAGAAANPFANALVRRLDPAFDEVLCGTVVIVGTNESGEDVDVPAGLLKMARELDSDE